MLKVRATLISSGERVTLTVVENPTTPRLQVTEPVSMDYIDIGHFLEDWTRVAREDPEPEVTA